MNFKGFILGILFGSLILLVVSILKGCSTFRTQWIKHVPDECNMALNIMSYGYKSKDKSGSQKSIEYCFKAMHRERCRNEVFSGAVVYSDAVRYRDYTQCLSELR